VKAAALLLLLMALAPSAAEAKGGGPACPIRGSWSFARKADLPRGAAAALGFPMAERGGRWNVGDAILPGPMLPFARFIAARQDGCALAIRYEHGGIAHTYETALLAWRGPGTWTLVRAR
jgi:hypothetical protein